MAKKLAGAGCALIIFGMAMIVVAVCVAAVAGA